MQLVAGPHKFAFIIPIVTSPEDLLGSHKSKAQWTVGFLILYFFNSVNKEGRRGTSEALKRGITVDQKKSTPASP
ncbi:hypothetical protein L596_015630 [Steinernema carpocapsae]|uniref:Uncharacterized protein n=1 Tax=Steinernema carpocapsae TaxID=34508 RepID=A0A4U5NGE6_STECR|nr:hypothetical protein L596_015630 [Steinernema carpocapsae]